VAMYLRSRLQELTSLANSRDGVGNYVFAGFKDNAQPFTAAGGTVTYNGDSNAKLLQVGASRQMASNDTGDAVFMNVPASLVYSASSTGGASMSSVVVTDSSQVKPGHQYQITFDTTGPTYSVLDTTTDPNNPTLVKTGPYNSPQTIAFDGIEMVASGTVTASSKIDLKPAPSQSMFATMDDLIAALEKPVSTPDERKMLSYKLSAAGENIDNALDKVLTTRASTGSRLKELDSLDDAGSMRDIQYADQLSTIQDVDYVKAISDLSQKQMMLQAAQQSFVKVSGLSLFNYL
jgi:flagellar hook-associated protein 3 FlgL